MAAYIDPVRTGEPSMYQSRDFIRWLAVPALVGLLFVGNTRADDNEGDALKKKILELNKITGEDQLTDKLREMVKDKANTTKLLRVADDMAKLDSKQFTYNSANILAGAARILKDNDIALRFLRICEKKARDIKSGKKTAESIFAQVLIHTAKKDYEQAEELCRKVLEENLDDEYGPEFFELFVQTLTRQGKVEEALKELNKQIDKNPAGWYFLNVKAWVQHESGKPEDAAKTYLEFIEKVEKNEALTPDIQERIIDRTKYILSNVYVDLNQIDKAAANLKDLLKKKPDNSTYNNDLGYIWADHDMNLEEAEKLIRKAIDEDRKARKKDKDLLPDEDHDNAAYLDSLGWVLFKKKQFAEAKKYLQEAVKDKEGQHIEIIDHLGDVHMALGEKSDAIKTWKQALEQETSTRRDFKRREEVIKKIKAAEGK
jgi:tetratricopeptide (TPR) repeat protein